MLPYTGNANYCYSNSLHMSLRGSGAQQVPDPGFLECLTTMPFGNMYLDLKSGPLVFFSPHSLNPDQGLTLALEALGWNCEVQRGGEASEALEYLRKSVARGPVLVGPIDMGYLTYNPIHKFLIGADHFAVVLALHDDCVLLHDPVGYPCVALSLPEFLQSWKAERIDYSDAPYTMRTDFRQARQVSRAEMIAHTLPMLHQNVQNQEEHLPNGSTLYGGTQVFTRLTQDLCKPVPASLANHLYRFAFPLAARRALDASTFMYEAGKLDAAMCLQEQAQLFGLAQYRAVQKKWSKVSALIEQLGALEEKFVAAL
jgi:hypothetical protein